MRRVRQLPSVSGKTEVLFQSAAKYSLTESSACHSLLLKEVTGPARGLIQASMTTGSWNKLHSALQCFLQFKSERKQAFTWPLSDVVLCDFVSWAITFKGLKPSSVKTYLSNLSTIHELKGLGKTNCFQTLTKRALKGAENVSFYKNLTTDSRKVMTLPLLKLLGHEIAKSKWTNLNKQVFWMACTTAFFGSFRFGEILAPSEWAYNKHETLLWSDITFRRDSVLIHVKFLRTEQGTVSTSTCSLLMATIAAQ